ncbi:hypothetical protein MCY_00377 [Bartonella rattimassiliensis 15908]|uniref:Uncharacterized protein n=2 Tax=Bartonella rattimassiliensis TaxID=270250 RepID=J0ZGK3_9HYPH|nr:hypothetical protein MCY_00377 [Bartonella rattimassiliensis 15908]
MPLVKRLRKSNGINLFGVMTLIYDFDQILGSLLTSLMQFGSYIVIFSVICGAVALFIAAGIGYHCLCKKMVDI